MGGSVEAAADEVIGTARLVLRAWRNADRLPYRGMSRSPAVMTHLGGPIDGTAADADIDRAIAHQAAYGHAYWAMERRADSCLLGFCGLKRLTQPGTPVSGDIDIGWRLREDAWGRGYALEAARAALAWGWRHLDVPRIVAMTVPANGRSWGLMERLGMTRRSDLDFGHPLFAPGHPLHAHLVYVADRPA